MQRKYLKPWVGPFYDLLLVLIMLSQLCALVTCITKPPVSQCAASPHLFSWHSSHSNVHLCYFFRVSRPLYPSFFFPPFTPMADLQRAATHARGARCCGDVDGQRSDPHQRESTGNAARFLQVPTTKHQASRRRCAPLLVRFPRYFCTFVQFQLFPYLCHEITWNLWKGYSKILVWLVLLIYVFKPYSHPHIILSVLYSMVLSLHLYSLCLRPASPVLVFTRVNIYIRLA